MTFVHGNEIQKTVRVEARYVWFDEKRQAETFLQSDGCLSRHGKQQAIAYDLYIVGGPCHPGKYGGYHVYDCFFEKELQKARQGNPAFVMGDVDISRLNSAAIHYALRTQHKKNMEIYEEKDRHIEIQQGVRENGRQIVIRPYPGDKPETEILKLMMFSNAHIPARRLNDEWMFMHEREGIGLKITTD